MKRFAAVALFASLAVSAFAQGGNPPPPRPGGPPPRGAGDEERARLKDDLASVEDELAQVEDRMALAKTEKEKDELEVKKAALMGKREALRAAIGARRGPDGPPPDPRMREMHDKLAVLEAMIEKLQADKKFEEARRASAEADELRRQIREMEENRAATDPNGGPPRPPRVAVTAEDRERAIVWMKENEPTRLDRLSQLKAEKRFEEYDRAMTQTAWEIRDLLAMQKNDPQRFERRMEQRKLDYHASELAEKIRGAGDNQDTSSERQDLEDVLGKLFDLRETDREAELKRLEDELTRLKETMKKRKAGKAKIVEARMKELLGEVDDDMKWEPGPGPGGRDGNPPSPPMPPPTPR